MRRDFLRAFEEELAALYERSGQLVSRYPELGLTLSKSSLDKADISMRMLLEGSAYLSARASIRADHTNRLLALRLASLLHPGILEPIPPRCLVSIRPPENGTQPLSNLLQPTIVLNDQARRRFETTSFARWNLSPVEDVEFDVRWLGREKGALLDLRIRLGDKRPTGEIRSIVLFVKSGAPQFEASLLTTGTLLATTNGKAKVTDSLRHVSAHFEPVECSNLWTEARHPYIQSDLARLHRYLHWPDLGGFVRLTFSQPLVAASRSLIACSFHVPNADESWVRQCASTSIMANILPLENIHRRLTERYAFDARKANNYFSLGSPKDRTQLVRAVAVRAYKPSTNIRHPCRLISYVGSPEIDRTKTGELCALHEPAWAQPDQGAGAPPGCQLDRLIIVGNFRGTDGTETPAGKLDVTIECDVYEEQFSSLVAVGAAVQAEVDGVVIEGSVIGSILPAHEDIEARSNPGEAINLGLRSIQDMARLDKEALCDWLNRLVVLASPEGSLLRAAWLNGIVSASISPKTSVVRMSGVAAVNRGWCIQIIAKRSSLVGGAFVYVATALHRYLSSCVSVNSMLEMILVDDAGSQWQAFGVPQ